MWWSSTFEKKFLILQRDTNLVTQDKIPTFTPSKILPPLFLLFYNLYFRLLKQSYLLSKQPPLHLVKPQTHPSTHLDLHAYQFAAAHYAIHYYFKPKRKKIVKLQTKRKLYDLQTCRRTKPLPYSYTH